MTVRSLGFNVTAVFLMTAGASSANAQRLGEGDTPLDTSTWVVNSLQLPKRVEDVKQAIMPSTTVERKDSHPNAPAPETTATSREGASNSKPLGQGDTPLDTSTWPINRLEIRDNIDALKRAIIYNSEEEEIVEGNTTMDIEKNKINNSIKILGNSDAPLNRSTKIVNVIENSFRYNPMSTTKSLSNKNSDTKKKCLERKSGPSAQFGYISSCGYTKR